MKPSHITAFALGLGMTSLTTAALAQHKTGVNIDFHIDHEIGDKDEKVEGDRHETEFHLKKARWFLSGKMPNYGYKVEYDFAKGPVVLRSVRFDYYLTKDTMISMGKGFKPIPISGPHKYFKGDIGVQLATKFDGGSFKVGVAHRKPEKWKNGIGGFTTLKPFAAGIELKGKSGGFEPHLRYAAHSIPAEKVIATGYRYHGRNKSALTVGATYKHKATKVFAEVGTVTRGEVKESLNGGTPYKIKPKREYSGYKIEVTQGFTSQWSGKATYRAIEGRDDGRKTDEKTDATVEVSVKPNPKDPLSFFLKYGEKTDKKTGKKRKTFKKISLGAKASPSVVIAKK